MQKRFSFPYSPIFYLLFFGSIIIMIGLGKIRPDYAVSFVFWGVSAYCVAAIFTRKLPDLDSWYFRLKGFRAIAVAIILFAAVFSMTLYVKFDFLSSIKILPLGVAYALFMFYIGTQIYK